MTEPVNYAGRRRAAAESIEREYEVGTLLVTNLANIRYLTGFSGSNATLLLTLDGPDGHVLATDGRYDTQAQAEVDGLGHDVRLVISREESWLQDLAHDLLGDARELAVEADDIDLARALDIQGWDPAVQIIPTEGVVAHLRHVKDEEELAVLRRACAITRDAFDAMWQWLAPGMTERLVAHRLLGEMIERGADGAAFEFIVASGPNGAKPHHHPTARQLRPGDLVTVDAGARVAGYHADMTRTVALSVAPSQLAEVFDIVAQAQYRGVLACQAGSPAAGVDEVCREYIGSLGHGDHFTHPTGHGVGLDIHEPPILHGRQTATLRTGMAVTVEPGIYLPGVGGIRIEDVVEVTAEGPVPLTTRATSTLGAHEMIELIEL